MKKFFVLSLSVILLSITPQSAQGQAFSPPSSVKAESIEVLGVPAVQLTWKNNDIYINGIDIERNGAALASVAGSDTIYIDNTVVIGTDYTYNICGNIGGTTECTEIQITAKSVDYDVIVSRVYKNLNLLSVRQWYDQFAPNPVGEPEELIVDGYRAIQDGTSVYVGVASCVNPTNCTGANGIYANILLLSYNLGARSSTIDIFSQLINTIRINHQLTTNAFGQTKVNWSCNGDQTIICDDGHDQLCEDAGAGICTSPRAELRRDLRRVVDLHDIANSLYEYAASNRFCDDGSNTRACNVDNDCGRDSIGNQILCKGKYPALSSGSYLGGMSTSQWPSWNGALASELGTSLPVDPINKFGAAFYRVSPPPDSCNDYPGHDVNSCWNERTLEFKCHIGSEVYIYKTNAGAVFTLYGQVEGVGWAGNWFGIDSNININMQGAVCQDVNPLSAVCGNGVVEVSNGEQCDGGFTNYCDTFVGQGDWNNEFTIGCDPTTCTWVDPDGGNPLGPLHTACTSSGNCGDGTINYPYELCEGSQALGPGPDGVLGTADDTTATIDANNPGGLYSCTYGGNPSCNNQCQVQCTNGRPYIGDCGDGVVQLPEACDDGSSNGLPGKCNLQCSGYGSFCGDGILTPTQEISLGCTCDDSINPAPATYQTVKGPLCSKSCNPAIKAHTYSYQRNAEECDTVIGLTSYSCPTGSALYCDTNCDRACTNLVTDAGTPPNQILDTNNNRITIPIYEHYFASGDIEDYDYSTFKVARDTRYSTVGIAFYAYAVDPATSTCTGGLSGICRYYHDDGSTYIDYALDFCSQGIFTYNGIPYDYVSTNPIFCVATTDQDPAGYTGVCSKIPTTGIPDGCNDKNDCTVAGSECIIGGVSSPVYEFYKNSNDEDFYVSRNLAPRSSVSTFPYKRFDLNNPLFYAWTGPFQQSCGNDIIEGSETCEPDIYQKPGPEDATDVYTQYLCGTPSSPNSCQVYGGYCGDGDGFCTDNITPCFDDNDCLGADTCVGVDEPFEACDEGIGAGSKAGICEGSAVECDSDIDCLVAGWSNCIGNGSLCNNATDNCSYCTDTCGVGLLPRNYCGDGIINNGPDGIPGTLDGIEEVCDDGVDNGSSGACNQTCTGITGSVCGNNSVEPGEVCDQGPLNGLWTYSCGLLDGLGNQTACTLDAIGDAKCDAINPGDTCDTVAPFAYCSYTCLGPTIARCGDSVIQDPNGAGVSESCDDGFNNGKPGFCNTSCNGYVAGVCGDTIQTGLCSNDTGNKCDNLIAIDACVTGGGVCFGETCEKGTEFPSLNTKYSAQCLDNGTPGLIIKECKSVGCQRVETKCQAYGLKIWSDAVDVAYLNGKLMLLNPSAVSCTADPNGTLTGANYADSVTDSPNSTALDSFGTAIGNACGR